MKVITALSSVTIGGAPPLREYVALAEKYGFGGIEFNIDEAVALADETSWDSVGNLFEQFGVAPAVFGLPVDWRHDEEAFQRDLGLLPARAKAATLIGCSRTATWLPPAISTDPAEFSTLLAVRFRAVADILAEFNIRLALEFVGPETLRVGPSAMGPNPFIYNIAQTVELIDTINAPKANVGLLVDSFHWFTSEATIDDLLALPPSQIVHVHINDAPDRPIHEQKDFERLLPGDGIIDLKGFLRTLAGVGYSGFVAVETFNKELTAQGPDRAAALTEIAVEKLVAGL